MESPFHPRDHAALLGPPDAFDPGHWANPTVYAVQNHLALEIVAQLTDLAVPFEFQGGTALHAKLGTQTRFSTDVDLRAPNAAAVHQGLRAFVARFPNSDVQLVEPPTPLKVDGVRHILRFARTGGPSTRGDLQILVEVVPDSITESPSEALRLTADGFAWPATVMTPTLEVFVAQKFSVFGPTTIGKAIGRNATHARANQSVSKQVFDLRLLLGLPLEGDIVLAAYEREVRLANRLRGSSFSMGQILDDARALVEHLRGARTTGAAPDQAYGLWSGFDDSRRWIRTRPLWTAIEYRRTAGILHRLAGNLEARDAHLAPLRRRLDAEAIPAAVATRLNDAVAKAEAWVPPDRFGGSAALAWAWSPADFD